MGGMCIANGCNNRKELSRASDLTFHKFPVSSVMKDKWVKAVKKDDWKPSKNSLICSKHFKEDDFDKSSPFRTYLKKSAVPSIFPTPPKKALPKPKKSLKREEFALAVIPKKVPKLSKMSRKCNRNEENTTQTDQVKEKIRKNRKRKENLKLSIQKKVLRKPKP